MRQVHSFECMEESAWHASTTHVIACFVAQLSSILTGAWPWSLIIRLTASDCPKEGVYLADTNGRSTSPSVTSLWAQGTPIVHSPNPSRSSP